MSNEILKRDQNHVTVIAGITDDSDQDIKMLRVDPITKRLLVKATLSGGGVTDVTATLPITSSGGTTPNISTSMATNKLIGRGTAGTGVMEEITLGTGLSFTGTTLNASGGVDGSGTANQITYWVDTDTIGALTVATYPSLTELSYVKGVTSAIQTQLDAKVPTSRTLTINGTAYDLSANRSWTVGSVDGTGAANQVTYWSDSDTITGGASNTIVNGTTPEQRLTETTNSEYTRLTKLGSASDYEAKRVNRVNVPGGANAIDLNGSTAVPSSGRTGIVLGNGTIDYPFSVSVWFNPSNASNVWLFMAADGGTSKWGMFLSNQFYMDFYGVSGGYIERVSSYNVTSNLNTWINVILTYDGSRTLAGVNLYVNNTLSNGSGSESAYTGFANTAGGGIYFGADNAGANKYDGKIGQVIYYDKVINSTERAAIYNAGAGAYITDTADIEGLWQFDEGSGLTSADQSGNGNTVTLNNATWTTGHITSPGGVQEVQVYKSQNGANTSEQGIHTWGNVAGRAVIEGNLHNYNIGGSTKATWSTSGFVIADTLQNTGATTLIANSASVVPLKLKLASSQTADGFQIQNSSGTNLLFYDTTYDLMSIGTDLNNSNIKHGFSAIYAEDTHMAIGQDATHMMVQAWSYNATPASASAQIVTYGYSNPIFIDGSHTYLQGQKTSGNVGIGYATTPPQKLSVSGNIGVTGKMLWNPTDSTNWAMQYVTSPTGAQIVTGAALTMNIFGDTYSQYGLYVRNDANVSLMEISGGGGVLISAGASTRVPLKIKGASSQSADLFEALLSTGTVTNTIDASGLVYIQNQANPALFLDDTNTSSSYGYISFLKAGANRWNIRKYADAHSTTALQNAIQFYQIRDKGNNVVNRSVLTLADSGNIGVNNTDPQFALDITYQLNIGGNANPAMYINETDGTGAYGTFAFLSGGNNRYQFRHYADSYTTTALQNAVSIYEVRDKGGSLINLNRFVLDDAGNVGIGTDTTAPAYKLDVNGVIRGTAYRVNGNAGADGTFTTADAKTVTVEKGIITSIV